MGWDRGECMYSHAIHKIDFRWPWESATSAEAEESATSTEESATSAAICRCCSFSWLYWRTCALLHATTTDWGAFPRWAGIVRGLYCCPSLCAAVVVPLFLSVSIRSLLCGVNGAVRCGRSPMRQ
jgi:hypothetical protein